MAKSTPKRTQRGADKMAASIKKRQDKEMTLLLQALEESPNLGQALARVGINRSTYYRWRQCDEVFLKNADDAIRRGIEKTADMVESSMLNSARDGNVQAQKYYLEHNHPRYKKRTLLDLLESDGRLTPEREQQIAEAMRNWFYKPISGDARFSKS